MKKIAILLLALVMALAAVFAEEAEEEAPTVYVTLAAGELVLAQEPIELTDADGDGALTINDALYLAHEEYFEGGAEAGYANAETQWGLSVAKLWGIENGGSYGYYVNNASAFSPLDELKDGDHLDAFVYTDLVAWTDVYCYFNTFAIDANAGEEVTLTLLCAGYDDNWAPVTLPVEGARLVFDDEVSDYVTDAEGNVTFTVPEGVFVISAVSDAATLVPPVCLIYLPTEEEAVA